MSCRLKLNKLQIKFRVGSPRINISLIGYQINQITESHTLIETTNERSEREKREIWWNLPLLARILTTQDQQFQLASEIPSQNNENLRGNPSNRARAESLKKTLAFDGNWERVWPLRFVKFAQTGGKLEPSSPPNALWGIYKSRR